MKKFLLLLILFFCLVIGGCWAVKTCFLSKGKLVVVTIEPGASGSSVARTLKEKGIIKSQFFFIKKTDFCSFYVFFKLSTLEPT